MRRDHISPEILALFESTRGRAGVELFGKIEQAINQEIESKLKDPFFTIFEKNFASGIESYKKMAMNDAVLSVLFGAEPTHKLTLDAGLKNAASRALHTMIQEMTSGETPLVPQRYAEIAAAFAFGPSQDVSRKIAAEWDVVEPSSAEPASAAPKTPNVVARLKAFFGQKPPADGDAVEMTDKDTPKPK